MAEQTRNSSRNSRMEKTIIYSRPDANPPSGTGLSIPPDKQLLPLPFEAGDYTATELLAKGGMSTTYRGHSNNQPDQQVVIKIPDTSSSQIVKMFNDECELLKNISHPNIVPVIL